MKVAPIMAAAERWNREKSGAPGEVAFEQTLVHTGQHYDRAMSEVFFEDLGLPAPTRFLGTGSGSHAYQTASVMTALEPVLLEMQPDLVVVVGDVNSTLAAALTAAKLQIPVAHVEAGLRSRDRSMPEELNRIVTDAIANVLFTTCRDADQNLLAEGIAAEKIHFVGNPMIDSLEMCREKALGRPILATLGLEPHQCAVVTLHRPSNVDSEDGLRRVADVLRRLSRMLPVVFPVHARTRRRLDDGGFAAELGSCAQLRLTEPLGYLDFLALMAQARLVLTDSGGIQEETSVLGVPCVTVRKSTERPVTITEGTNRLADPDDVEAIMQAVDQALSAAAAPSRPELWDGHAGERIVRAFASLPTPAYP